MVRFLDSSVFLHAYLKPKRNLTPEEENVKLAATKILDRVEKGEDVATSVIHISEAINIVEARLGLKKALELLENCLATNNLSVLTVSRGDYEKALFVAARYGVSPNDAVAALLLREKSITEIYGFDRHFDNIPFIKRVTE